MKQFIDECVHHRENVWSFAGFVPASDKISNEPRPFSEPFFVGDPERLIAHSEHRHLAMVRRAGRPEDGVVLVCVAKGLRRPRAAAARQASIVDFGLACDDAVDKNGTRYLR